jgi:hypothetical protein
MGSSISKEDDDIASSSAPVVWFGKSIYVVFATKFRRSSLRFKKKVHPDEVDKEWQYYWWISTYQLLCRIQHDTKPLPSLADTITFTPRTHIL